MRDLKRMYKALRYASWAALGALLLALVAIRLGAVPRARRARWVWLLVAALLGLLFLCAIGLGILWLAGALYEDIIVLMVGLCATVVAVPTLLAGVVMAWQTVSSRQSGATSFRR